MAFRSSALFRPAIVVVGLLAVGMTIRPATAFLTEAERQTLDVNQYTVKDRTASYFDVDKRIELLQHTKDPELREIRNRLAISINCEELKNLPVVRSDLALPSFYNARPRWEIATQPMFEFEDTMSKLAGAFVATGGDPYYGNCIVDILEKWAEADALRTFEFNRGSPQAWYGIESMIFAAALSYSVIYGRVDIEPERVEKIEKWMKRIAWHHFTRDSGPPSTYNNHYYRRALYMTAIGVVTGDNKMFQAGIKAPIAALHDIGKDGQLGLSMERGRRAVHYHNYSLQYLILNMQLAYRQGYDMFDMEAGGHTMSEAVGFIMHALRRPGAIEDFATLEQDMAFTRDDQYFAWMEVWLRHRPNDELMQDFVNYYRPIYNRSAGGYATFYFKKPEHPQAVTDRQLARHAREKQREGEVGMRYRTLEKWRRTNATDDG